MRRAFLIILMATPIIIRPQPGPQEQFLASPADIVIVGGSAGVGKTWGLLAEPCRHINVPGFYATIFRRTSPEITNEGALWDDARKIYPLLGGRGYESNPRMYEWPSGARVAFHHLQYEQDVEKWKSSQVTLIEFDQLETFTSHQFWYMLSRNRSLCGIRPYIRASCNPDPDCFLSPFATSGDRLLAWWIDPETGYAIAERSGVVRYFIRYRDALTWYDDSRTAQEAARDMRLVDNEGQPIKPKSFTFIGGTVFDNRILLEKDPGYLANLYSLAEVEQERLLRGNWKIRRVIGTFFREHWMVGEGRMIESMTRDLRHGMPRVRGWDLASGTAIDTDDTAAVRMCQAAPDLRLIDDVVRHHGSPADRDAVARLTLERDAEEVRSYAGTVEWVVEMVPGLGTETVNNFIRMINTHAAKIGTLIRARAKRVNKSKEDRAVPLAIGFESGRVKLVKEGSNWLPSFVAQLAAFPSKGVHDDMVDAASAAYNSLDEIPRVTIDPEKLKRFTIY